MSKKTEPESSKPTDDSTEKKQSKNLESSLISPSLKFQILIGLTCFATVAASYGVQYYRERFVIPPQKEKTFPFLMKSIAIQTIRNVPGSDSLLRFVHSSPQNNNEYKIQILDQEEQPVTIEKLDFYEFSNSEVYQGGKVTYQYANLVTSISHVFDSDSSVNVLIDCTGKNDAGNTSDQKIHILIDGKIKATVILNAESKLYYHISSNNTEAIDDEAVQQIQKSLEDKKTTWEEKFESSFRLNDKRMPKPYQDIAESALALAMNSFSVNKTAEFKGFYNKKFANNEPFYFIQSVLNPLTSLDEQVFPLIVTSKINAEDTLKVFHSWISTINEHGEMGNLISNGVIQLGKTQSPMLFQLLKEIVPNHLFDGKLEQFMKNIEEIAENTWKNSVGKDGLNIVRWLGSSRGLFELEAMTPEGESSYELLCLLEDMCKVMEDLCKIAGVDGQKWVDRAAEAETVRVGLRVPTGRDSHVPLILSLLKPDSDEFTQSLDRLQQDALYGTTGLQLSEEYGAPISTNFLLLRSLKKYKASSGPSQEKALQLYSHLKNSLIAAIARSNRPEKSFYGKFSKDMKPLGKRGNLDGTLVLPIMAELQKQN